MPDRSVGGTAIGAVHVLPYGSRPPPTGPRATDVTNLSVRVFFPLELPREAAQFLDLLATPVEGFVVVDGRGWRCGLKRKEDGRKKIRKRAAE